MIRIRSKRDTNMLDLGTLNHLFFDREIVMSMMWINRKREEGRLTLEILP